MPKLKTITCKRCWYTWVPRVPNPGVCTKCHSANYRTPKLQAVASAAESGALE